MERNPEPVLRFVAEQLGVDRNDLGLHTTLYADLQLYGDDCDEFFPAFAKRFSVSLDDLKLSDYFPPEPYLGPRILRMMARRIFVSSDPHQGAEVTPLRIADLVEWGQVMRRLNSGSWRAARVSKSSSKRAARGLVY